MKKEHWAYIINHFRFGDLPMLATYNGSAWIGNEELTNCSNWEVRQIPPLGRCVIVDDTLLLFVTIETKERVEQIIKFAQETEILFI